MFLGLLRFLFLSSFSYDSFYFFNNPQQLKSVHKTQLYQYFYDPTKTF